MRLKEIINRGGEKISPREVDEILMDHPAVSQCVTFAVPHDKLGEDVAAAIVLREGAEAIEKEIRSFASERLSRRLDHGAVRAHPRHHRDREPHPQGGAGHRQEVRGEEPVLGHHEDEALAGQALAGTGLG